MKSPRDLPPKRVAKALCKLGFEETPSGTNHRIFKLDSNTISVPCGHAHVKWSTLQNALRVANVERNDFLRVWSKV